MITALIPLPNFLVPPGPFSDTPTIVSNCSDEYEDDVAHYQRGLTITIPKPPQLYKYRIVITETLGDLLGSKNFLHNPSSCMSESEIIFISTAPINLETYECNPYNVIYPLYGRACGMTVLFTKSIERLLNLADFYAESELITPIEFIQEKMTMLGGILQAGDTEIITGYSPVAWKHSMEEIVNLLQVDLDATVSELVWIPSMFPPLFRLASEAVSWQSLKMYVNGFADKTNNVRNGVVGSMIRWGDIQNRLISQGRLFTVPYNTLSARMDLLVYYAHLIGPDFFVTVDMADDHFDIPDLYLQRISLDMNFEIGGMQRSENIKQFVRLLCQATDNPWAGSKVRIHKSCMEDIVVYDANTQEILLYLDLVWWTVAASNGLINRTAKE